MEIKNVTFANLPSEIIQSLLFYLPPKSLCDVRATSKRLQGIADASLLWRYHCRTQYRFWDDTHQISKKLRGPATATDWKSLFMQRTRTDEHVEKHLDQVIRSSRYRIAHIEAIVRHPQASARFQHTYDVKDVLLKHCNTPEDQEDYLARRYWAKATLERLHRALAIERWKELRHQTVSLEKALGAFDMFVIGTEEGDFNDIHSRLDNLASKFLADTACFNELSTRWKAHKLSQFLQAENFVGADSEEDYHNLHNSFLSQILRGPDHRALPLICAVVFCCVATRVGLFARPCGFPMHVYAIVSPPDGRDLDGREISMEAVQERMYIDVFRSVVDVPITDLKRGLRRLGTGLLPDELYLGPASTLEIALRTSRNIMNSVTIIQSDARNQPYPLPNNDLPRPSWATVSPDMDSAFYASLWAAVLLHDHSTPGDARRLQYIPFISEHFQSHFPWDAQLIADHVAPLFRGHRIYLQLCDTVHSIQEKDENAVQAVKRDNEAKSKVNFRVGQHFRHRRYWYEGIIIGWDTCCEAGESWINHMGVDRLDGGRGQSFYHVLADDKSSRYVAEENIAITQDEPTEAMMSLAGRYFKRWDKEKEVFISNIKEEYPDD